MALICLRYIDSVERSRSYDTFLEEQEIHLGFYETAAKWAYGFVGLDIKSEKVDREMEDAEFAIRFKHAFCLAIITALLALPVSVAVYFIGGNTITTYLAVLLPFIVFGAFAYIPSYLARLRKLKIIGQAPLAILYLVIASNSSINPFSSQRR